MKHRWPVLLFALMCAHCSATPSAGIENGSVDAAVVDEASTTVDGGAVDAGPDALAEAASPPPCPGTSQLCGSECLDLTNDNAHCGTCTTACPLSQACLRGTCQTVCATGQLLCDGRCANLDTDNANCGGCGNLCPGGKVCSHGQCSATCASDLVLCGDHCANTANDPKSCGSCGNLCPTTPNALPVCAQGACATTCMAHYSDCNGDAADGCESNLDSSAVACGGCGKSCLGPSVASATCTAGVCSIATCTFPYGDCDHVVSNGCERYLNYDTQNCGACGSVCPTPAHSYAYCFSTCTSQCTYGFSDCDGNAATGCETDTMSGRDNCGYCGHACDPGATCSYGSCVCPVGMALCGGHCIGVTSDAANCGACGHVCSLPNSTGATCASSACAVGTCSTGFDDCDLVAANGCEAHLKTNGAHCGACGTACTAGQACSNGVCTAAPACVVVAAPRVLAYHVPLQNMFAELPSGSSVTVANDALWSSYTTAKFAAFDLIVIGSGGYPNAADLQNAYLTRAVWSPAVTGRIVVNGLDGGAWYGGDPTTFHKAIYTWLTSGLGTALYVASDYGQRSLDFLNGFGAFSSTPNDAPPLQIIESDHPVLAGSTNASLGYYGYATSRITVPTTFEVLVVGAAATPTLAARDVLCAP